MIVIEDLKVSNMSKSAAGTVSQPGRNVRAKSGLNRSSIGIKIPKRLKKHHKTDVSSTPPACHECTAVN
ncbi:methionyl-tRNA formyltransferase [Escherichia coli]|nr:methionyl-tRNA formyltransferase [Escherichia coli]